MEDKMVQTSIVDALQNISVVNGMSARSNLFLDDKQANQTSPKSDSLSSFDSDIGNEDTIDFVECPAVKQSVTKMQQSEYHKMSDKLKKANEKAKATVAFKEKKLPTMDSEIHQIMPAHSFQILMAPHMTTTSNLNNDNENTTSEMFKLNKNVDQNSSFDHNEDDNDHENSNVDDLQSEIAQHNAFLPKRISSLSHISVANDPLLQIMKGSQLKRKQTSCFKSNSIIQTRPLETNTTSSDEMLDDSVIGEKVSEENCKESSSESNRQIETPDQLLKAVKDQFKKDKADEISITINGQFFSISKSCFTTPKAADNPTVDIPEKQLKWPSPQRLEMNKTPSFKSQHSQYSQLETPNFRTGGAQVFTFKQESLSSSVREASTQTLVVVAKEITQNKDACTQYPQEYELEEQKISIDIHDTESKEESFLAHSITPLTLTNVKRDSFSGMCAQIDKAKRFQFNHQRSIEDDSIRIGVGNIHEDHISAIDRVTNNSDSLSNDYFARQLQQQESISQSRESAVSPISMAKNQQPKNHRRDKSDESGFEETKKTSEVESAFFAQLDDFLLKEDPSSQQKPSQSEVVVQSTKEDDDFAAAFFAEMEAVPVAFETNSLPELPNVFLPPVPSSSSAADLFYTTNLPPVPAPEILPVSLPLLQQKPDVLKQDQLKVTMAPQQKETKNEQLEESKDLRRTSTLEEIKQTQRKSRRASNPLRKSKTAELSQDIRDNRRSSIVSILQPIQETMQEHSNSLQSSKNSSSSSSSDSSEADNVSMADSDVMVLHGRAFGHGDLRDTSVDLRYLPLQKTDLVMKKSQTGNDLQDFITKQATGLGLSPDIFLSKDSHVDSKHDQKKKKQAPEVSDVASILSRSRTSQSSIQQSRASYSSQLTDFCNSLASTQKANTLKRISTLESTNTQILEKTIKKLVAHNLFEAESSTIELDAKTKNSSVINSCEKSDHIDLKIIDARIKAIEQDVQQHSLMHDEITKNRLQVSILQYYLKTQKLEDEQKIETVNNAIKVLTSHERKLREISQVSQSEKHKLHFAFLFASPLVISGKGRRGQAYKNVYKLMPPLNFQKEYCKIKESIENAKVKLRLTKRQCTTTTLNEILAKNPLAIHFSGHGLLNNEQELGPELYKMHKDEGNFLLLETEDGSGNLVSTKTLRQMIQSNHSQDSLQLVVVATCHSQFVGEIFQEAGAQHVVCIQQQYEVEDDAIITFTDSFYGLLFNQKKICDAFEQAKYQVSLTHSEQQASIFKLLKHDDCDKLQQGMKRKHSSFQKRQNSMYQNIHTMAIDKKTQRNQSLRDLKNPIQSFESIFSKNPDELETQKPHWCSIFGPFDQGKLQIIDQAPAQLKNTAPLQANLIGRAVDKFKLVTNILDNKSSRLITMSGMPGVGKSSLMLSTLQWMHERSLLLGGSIYFNAGDTQCTQTFTRKLCNKMINENEQLFKSFKDDSKKRDPLQTLKLIISRLIQIDGEIILIIDNCEDLIYKDKINLRKLISYFLQRVPSLKVLLTSRVLLFNAAEFKEQIFNVQGLSNKQAASLFLTLSRVIDQNEQNRLLELRPNFERYPTERFKPTPFILHEHHLFTLLNGNPQSILLTVPVLNDQERCVDLAELYTMLTSDQIYTRLRKVEIGNKMLLSLRLSAQVSIQHILTQDGQALDLFFLLGQLPGGIDQFELELLWVDVCKKFAEVSNVSSVDSSSSCTSKSIAEIEVQHDAVVSSLACIDLKQAYKELLKANIIQTLKPETRQGDAVQNLPIIIGMPEYVRNFSEGLIDEQRYHCLNQVLVKWIHKLVELQYLTRANKNSSEEPLSEADSERLDKNFMGFLKRILEESLGGKVEGSELGDDKDRDEFDDNFSEEAANLEANNNELDTSCFNPYLEAALDSQKESSPEQNNQQEKRVLNIQISRFSEKNSNSMKNLFSNRSSLGSKLLRTETGMRRLTQQKTLQEEDNVWTELEIADQDLRTINAKSSILNTTQNISQMQPPNIDDSQYISNKTKEERAMNNWSKILTKIKAKLHEQIHAAIAGLQALGGIQLEEEEDEHPLSPLNHSLTKNQRASFVNISRLSSSVSDELDENPIKEDFEKRVQTKQKTLKRIQTIDMYFRRGSISIHGQCLTNRSQLLKDLQPNEILSQEETTILYLLAAKICSDEHRKAQLIIKQKVLKMKLTSKLFQGNVRRLQAFLAMSELKQLQEKSNKVDEQERTKEQIEIKQMEVQDYLERAINSFQQNKCQWGLALTYLQEALYLVINMQAVNQRMEEVKIISQNNIQTQTNPILKPTMKQKSFKIYNQALSNQLREEQKGLVDDFFSSIGDAIVNSQSIQHWKALSHAYRLVTQVCTEQKLEQAQTQAISDAFQPTQNGSSAILDTPDEIFMDARKKQREFFNLYKRNVMHNNTTQLLKAICIDREQGEDFSLMMEIVQKSQVRALFSHQQVAAGSRRPSYMSEEMTKSIHQPFKSQCDNLHLRNTMPKQRASITKKSQNSNNNNLAPHKTISESSEFNSSANSCLQVPQSRNGSIIESISGGNRSRTNSQRVVKSKTKLNNDHNENEGSNDHSLKSSFDSTRQSK